MSGALSASKLFGLPVTTRMRQSTQADLLSAAKGVYGRTRQVLGTHPGRLPMIRVCAASSRSPILYFLAPDFDKPAGGLRVIYRHVDLLNEAGVPAAVLHRRSGFRCSWFANRTRVEYLANTELAPNDILVVPDVYAPLMPDLPAGLRHLLFDQSGGHLSLRRDAGRISHHVRESPDLLGIVTVSAHGESLLRHIFPDASIHRVHLSVDPSMFFVERSPKRTGIVYLGRRGSADAENALHALRAREGLGDVPASNIKDVPQQELARLLRSASIFLHLPYQEGFGLPAVEAMASGAYVIGYHGYGGKEFMLPGFSQPVETGDLLGLVTQLEAALFREAREPGWLAERGREAAGFVVEHYRPERERTEVVLAYRQVVRR